jgi:hypothetical protein
MKPDPKRAAALLRAGAVITALVAAPIAASADSPGYATVSDPSIAGTVERIDGKYRIHVRDRRGYIDDVSLHQGTIINPTGLQLQPGEHVTIYGNPSGSTFQANEIDVPATVAIAPYGYRYGYPGYGFYGYRRFGFGFGYRGWW